MAGYEEKEEEEELSVEKQLFNAIFCNNRLKVLSILDSGFDVNIANDLGQTPIYVAAAIYKNMSMIRTLAHFNPDLEKKSDLQHTPLTKLLLKGSRDKDSEKVLEIIKALLEMGAKITTDCNGALPIHIAITAKRNMDIIRVLLGDDTINAQDKSGRTPLHLAVLHNRFSVVRTLIEYEYTDVNMHDNIGNTPLILATKMDNQKIASFLLNHGANIYLKNTSGEDFLACVVSNGKIYNIISQNDEFRTALEKSNIESKDKLNIDLSRPGPSCTKIFGKRDRHRPYVVPGQSTSYQHLNYENLPNYNSSMLQVVQHKNDELNTDPPRTPLSQLANISLELPRPSTASSRSTTSSSSCNSSLATQGSSNVNSPSSSLSESFVDQFGFSARVSSTSSSESDTMQNAKRRKLDCTFHVNRSTFHP
ncbi:MAG: ankyrin repeat domain-containing protein [Wolbachia endosymbiont of Xenopsylla cheopis]